MLFMTTVVFVTLLAATVAAGIAAALARRRAAVLLRRAERAETELTAERRVTAEKVALVERAEARLSDSFAALSAQALDRAGASFLDLATTALGRHTAEAKGDLDARRQAVESLVGPLRESLGKVEFQLGALEVSRRSAYAGLVEQVRSLADGQDRLRTETATLVTALRAPSVRGRWGELQLRRVVEMAGMIEHCDFTEQTTSDGENGRQRPDLIVRLPGGGSVAVDAKVPLQAYLEAVESPDEGSRKASMLVHARQLRSHVDALARKAYWEQIQPSPELVVLFVPGEAILSAALEAAPDLYDHAVAGSVLLTTPTSLIGLLRTISYGWRQEALAANAQQVCDLGRQLHTRLGTLVGHVDKLGRALDTAVGAYNDTVGTFESRVLVSARKFGDLQIADGGLDEPRQVDRAARRLRAAEPPRAAAPLQTVPVQAVEAPAVPVLLELPERVG
jgi:DNA recombination protein RmuC